MGMRDAEIKERQALIGLKPATGRKAELLRKMSDAAFELIKVIELERSGIRDGDGFWSSDVMRRTGGVLVGIINDYDWADDQEYAGSLPRDDLIF